MHTVPFSFSEGILFLFSDEIGPLWSWPTANFPTTKGRCTSVVRSGFEFAIPVFECM